MKTQVNPSSALKMTKHHQSDPSNVPGILGSNYLKRAYAHTSNSFLTQSNWILSYNQIRSPTGLHSSGFTTSLVYLTSVERVRGISLCSLERQDSLLLQGLKVAEDLLSEILTSTLPQLLLTGNQVTELTLIAFQSESGLQVTQRLSPFPLDVLTNYIDPNLIAPGRLVVSGWHFPLDSTWLSIRRLGNPESSHANRSQPGRYTRTQIPSLSSPGSRPDPFQSFKAQ